MSDLQLFEAAVAAGLVVLCVLLVRLNVALVAKIKEMCRLLASLRRERARRDQRQRENEKEP